MRCYDLESILLGTVLRYGTEAARLVLPQLTPDKFIFRTDGDFGIDHSIIWEAVSDTFYRHAQPTLTEVSKTLKGELYSEMSALVDRLEHQYKIYTFDPLSFQDTASKVDKQGIVYNMASGCAEIHESISDVEHFMQTVNGIEDIDQWASNQLSKFSKINTMKVGGYKHVSEIAPLLRDSWSKQLSGEETVLLDCGIPILMKNALFPKGKLAVIHGMSGTGKSTFVFQVALGTAIGLFLNDKQGCVAINSLEMEQLELLQRMTSILARVDVSRFLTGTITAEEVARLNSWLDFVEALPIYIDDTNFITTSAVQYRSQGLHVSNHGPVHQLISDYTELFRDEDSSEEQRVAKIVRQHFFLSRMINASVIIVSQSTINKETSKKTFIAGPDGTRYSTAIKHATDIQAEFWNPVSIARQGHTLVVPDSAEYCLDYPHIYIQKYRGAAEGAEIPLGWIPESTTLYDQDLNFGLGDGKEIIFTTLDKAYEKFKNNRSVW